jgi:hypothetical protein
MSGRAQQPRGVSLVGRIADCGPQAVCGNLCRNGRA